MNTLTEEEIFAAAIQKPIAERAEFLDRACAGNAALRGQVEALLAAHDKPDSFLEIPAEAVATIEQPVSERIGMQIGPYKLLQRLGEGGMGTVYLAEQQQPVKRQVALKIIKAGMDSAQVIARFEQERQALAIMDHPHIAKVLDAGTTDSGRPYFVMELVKGIPITRYCDQEHLSPKERLELFIPVCQAVQHAHQKGIIHRDLKPSNVLIALYDGRPVPKVIDFGVAKATSHKLTERTLFTEVGSIVGTLEYMAPEQAELNNLDIDTRADIYSLGVLLYELLTGATPFSGQQLRSAGFNEMLRIIKEVEPQKPSTKLSSSAELPSIAANRKLEPARLTRLVRGDLDWIVMKCLEKERNRRYDTANAFAQDIQHYLDDEPVIAGPPSTGYRLKKFLRRNKGPVLAAAVLLLTLLGGIVGTTWGLIRAEKSRQLADAARQSETLRAEAEARERRRAEAAETVAKQNELQAASERDRAEQEKRIAQAVKDFLQYRLLNQADAQKQADAILHRGGSTAEIIENPTIRELLDRAAEELTPENIDTHFPDLPLVKAEILGTVGGAYRGIAEFPRAISHLERSHSLYASHLGPTHQTTLTTLFILGEVYSEAGRPGEAVQVCQDLSEQTVARLGPDHPETLATLHILATRYHYAGRLPEAIALFEEVLAKRREVLGTNHIEYSATMNNLATTYRDARRFPESIKLLTELHESLEAELGDHPNALRAGWQLAWTYHKAGRRAEAVELFERLRRQYSASLGPDHPSVLIMLNLMAQAYQESGKVQEAVELIEFVRDKQIAQLGADHPHALSTQRNLAFSYREAGRFPEAIQLLESVRDRVIAKFGAKAEATLRSENALAWAYWYGGKFAEAARAFEELCRRSVELLGEDNPKTLDSMNGLAWSYQRLQRTQEAIDILEQVRGKLVARYGPDDSILLSTLNGLSQAYSSKNQWDQAIEVLERMGELQAAKYGKTHASRLSTLSRLASAYRATRKWREAAAAYEELLKADKERRGPNDPRTLTSLSNLATAYQNLRRLDEAAALFLELVEARRRTLASDDPNLANPLNSLGLIRLGQNRPAEAEPFLRESLAIYEKAQPENWIAFFARSVLGRALLQQKKLDEAEPLLVTGYNGMKQREDQIGQSFRTARLTEALQRLIDLYIAWDKPDEATKWRKTLDEQTKAEAPAATPD